jgi:hypothetical protein
MSRVDIPDYISTLEPIWIVRFTKSDNEVVQEGWISAVSGKTRWIFPNEKQEVQAKPAIKLESAPLSGR